MLLATYMYVTIIQLRKVLPIIILENVILKWLSFFRPVVLTDMDYAYAAIAIFPSDCSCLQYFKKLG